MSNETKPAVKKITREDFVKSVANIVSNDIAKLQENNSLVLPPNYAVGNAIQAAYLKLLTVEDKDKNNALAVCDERSVINAIRSMVIQGLTVEKNQGYFIVYGKQLSFQRSYFGTMAVAKRFASVRDVRAMVVLAGDKVTKEIVNGETRVVSHTSEWPDDKPITKDDIVAAYAVVYMRGSTDVRYEYMVRSEIIASWKKSKTNQGVHAEFPDQMAKRTVINRALKYVINSSDDSSVVVQAFNESGYIDDEEIELDTTPVTSFTETVTPSDDEAPQSPVPNTTAKQMSITDETEPF